MAASGMARIPAPTPPNSLEVASRRHGVACSALCHSGLRLIDCTPNLRGQSALRTSEFWSSQDELFRSSELHRGKRVPKKGSLFVPLALINRVSGSFWEEADSDSSASDRFSSLRASPRKAKVQSVLIGLISDVEPLDTSLISKDTSPNSMDAMKRTISGMLGLLPSDQFQVMVETDRECLGRLLVSSMMTGYTLRNAEYRMSLQRSLDLPETNPIDGIPSPIHPHPDSPNFSNPGISEFILSTNDPQSPICTLPNDLDNLPPDVLSYIHQLQSKVESVSKQLEECKRTLAAIELEDMVGDEPNDLLDYLRSLEPDKVAELSHPTSDVRDAIQQVIDDLLGNLSPVRSPLSPPLSNSPSTNGAIPGAWDENEPNSSSNLQFQSTISTTRDYLARLLFWCMMLGHYMRALEYRLELSRTFNLSCATNKFTKEGLGEGL